MKHFSEKHGPWALVTGASSGIGTEFVRQLAEKGLNIVLVARREKRLVELGTEKEETFGIQFRVVPVDLSRPDFLEPIRQATDDIEIGLLVNNAGFANSDNFLENALDDEIRMLQVNAQAPMILAHHFGQRMCQRGQGGIIFVASTVAVTGVPGWSTYAATKAFELTLSDGLSLELRRHGVSVLSVLPGQTQTEFWQVNSGRPFSALRPEQVVKVAIDNLGKRSTTVVGWLNKAIVFSTRFAPRRLNAAIFGKFIKIMKRNPVKVRSDNSFQPVEATPESHN